MIFPNSPPSLLFGPQMCLWWRKRDLKFPPLRLLPFKFKSTFWNSDFFVHCLKWRGPSADGCILPEEQLTGWNRFNPVETDNFKFGKTCRNLFSRGSKFSWMQLLGTIKCLLPLSQSFSLSLSLSFSAPFLSDSLSTYNPFTSQSLFLYLSLSINSYCLFLSLS